MIAVPVSPQTAVADWPRAGVPEFLFGVRSAGGQSLGNGIYEYDWTLTVDSRTALVSVESFRSDGDMAGQPVGVFRYAISDAQLLEFHRILTAARLGELRPAMEEHPGPTESLYRLAQPGAANIRLVVNNSDRAANAAIAPLRYKVTALLAGSFAHPERSVELGFARDGEIFTVTVRNSGVEKVCFTDPRWIRPEGRLLRAVVRITEFPRQGPGEAPLPLRWRELALAPLARRPAEEPLVTMAPGAVWKAAAPAAGLDPGKRYLAYFSWANYSGEAMVSGSYRIRGKADSPRLVIEGDER